MFKQVWVQLLIASSWPLASFAETVQEISGQERGGGSFHAAEVSRATEAFIELIEQNPQLFPEVDPRLLRSLDPEIKITTDKIEVCESIDQVPRGRRKAILDAFSDTKANTSVFHLGTWLSRGWIEKVQFAGHERLVLAGYERSNRYSISNRVFQAELNRVLDREFTDTDFCGLFYDGCGFIQMLEKQVEDVVELRRSREIKIEDATMALDDFKVLLSSSIRGQIVAYKAKLQKQLIHFTRPEKKIERYSQLVRAAMMNHFKPILDEAYIRIQNVENVENVENGERSQCVSL